MCNLILKRYSRQLLTRNEMVICHCLFFRRGLELLVAPNGWVDKTMTIGIKGMFALIAKGYDNTVLILI